MSGATFDRTDVDRVLAASADPFDVARRLQLRGRAEGHSFKALCPTHSEKTPSCSLRRNSRDGLLQVHCFGGCGLDGDIFDLVAAVEGLDRVRDFPAVLGRAADLFGVHVEPRARGGRSARRLPRPPPPTTPPLEPNAPSPLDAATFAALVAPLLHVGRLDHQSAIATDVCAYLDGRGLLDIARAEGWAALPVPECQRAWLSMLSDVFGPEAIARSGLVYTTTDFERIGRCPVQLRIDGFDVGADLHRFSFSEARLVIPWRAPDGTVQTLQRRRLDGREPKYVAATRRPPAWPYGVHHLAGAPADVPIAITEGAFDAAALAELCRVRGAPVLALGIGGVKSWRPAWASLARGRPAVVALDTDAAGESAAGVIARELAAAGALRVDRWRPAGGAHDWAEALLAGRTGFQAA